MAGRLERPDSVNELVRRVIVLQCRVIGNESDATLSRDLAYVEAEARRCVDGDIIDAIKLIATKTMTACGLNRHADRKNPVVFACNLVTLPAMRSRRFWAEAETIKNERLLPLVTPRPEDHKVTFRIVLSNVDSKRLQTAEDLRKEFVGVVQKAVASRAISGGGVVPDHVHVDVWADGELSITVTPPAQRSGDELQRVLLGATLKDFSVAMVENMSDVCRRALTTGEVSVTAISAPPSVCSDRCNAIFKVCNHAAWLEQNTRDWDGAQGGAITGAALGYKHSMAEDAAIVERYSKLMGFEGYG